MCRSTHSSLYQYFFFPFLLLIFLSFLAGCTAFPTAAPPGTATPTLSNTSTPTASPTPTSSPSPTETLLPSPTPTPTQPPFDLGNTSEMVDVLKAGEGTLGQVSASPDGQTLAVAGSEGIWLFDKLHLTTIAKITGHAGEVTSVSWSPDGTQLVSGGVDKTVRIWDVSQLLASNGPVKQVHLLIAHSQRVNAVAWSSNPAFVASAGEDGSVWIWELSKNQQGNNDARALHQLGHVTAVYDLAWHPGGRFLATASLDSTLDLWDAFQGVHLGTLEGHESWATTLAWNPTGDILASGATDRTLRLWDVSFNVPTNPSAKATARFQPRTIIQTLYSPNIVLWNPDGTQTVSGGGNPFTINFWDPSPSENLEEVELRTATVSLLGHVAPINGLAFVPGGALVSTSADTTLRVWNLTTGQEIRRISPFTNLITNHPFTAPVQAVTWSPDGTQLATAHSDYTLRIWHSDGISLTQTLVITGHQNLVTSVDWSNNGNWLATGSSDNTTRVWDAQTGELIQTLPSEGGKINAVSFAPFGNQLATGGLFRITQIWEVGTDQTPILLTINAEITALEWAPNGTLLAISGSDGDITIWDIPATSQLLLLSGEHNNPISSISWSSDGTRLATLDTIGKVVIWDTTNGLPINENIISGTRRDGLSWSPNGQLLATGNGTKLLILDAETLEPLRILTGHTGEIRDVAWKPDGSQIISVGLDSTLHLWAISSTLSNPVSTSSLKPSSDLPSQPKLPIAPITLENANQVKQLALYGHGTALHLALNPNGNTIAVAGGIGTWIYDSTTWGPLRLLTGNKTYASVWSPDGKLLAVRELNSILVWDVKHEQVLTVFGVDIGVWPNLAWSPDGSMLAAGNFRGFVRVFNLATDEMLYEWQPGQDITGLVWSPDGTTLAAGGTGSDTGNGMIWLWNIATGKPVNILEGHTARVTHLAWSPDGTQLLSASDDLALGLWDVSNLEPPPTPAEGEEIEFLPLTHQFLTANEIMGIKAVAWSTDSHLFMTADISGMVYFWGAESGLIQSSLTATQNELAYAIWSDDEAILSIGMDGTINTWNTATGENLATEDSHSAEVNIVQWAGSKNNIFMGHTDGSLKELDLPGNMVQSKLLTTPPSNMAYFSNTGMTAVRDRDGTVTIFQLDSEGDGRIVSQGTGDAETDWLADWSEDGAYLAWNQTRDETTIVEVLGVPGSNQFSLNGADAKITAISWSPDFTAEDPPSRNSTQTFRLSAGLENGKVIIWEVTSGRVIQTIQAYSGRVRVITWSHEGRYFATGGSDGQDNGGFQFVRIWDSNTGRLVRELELPFRHEAYSLVWSPDSTMLVSGDSIGDILLWNPENGELVGTLNGHKQTVVSLDWSRVSNSIVSGSRDGTVRVWGIGVEE